MLTEKTKDLLECLLYSNTDSLKDFEEHLEKMQAVVDASSKLVQCVDHAAASCASWCTHCQDEVRSNEALHVAHAALAAS